MRVLRNRLYICLMCLSFLYIPIANVPPVHAASELPASEVNSLESSNLENVTKATYDTDPSSTLDSVTKATYDTDPSPTLDIEEVVTIVPPVTVARGTIRYDMESLLPRFVEVRLSDGSSRSLKVMWDLSTIGQLVGEDANSFAITGKLMLDLGPVKGNTPNPLLTNSRNLQPQMTITYDSVAHSADMIQSIPAIKMPYDPEKQPNPTAGSLGLPSQTPVILGDNRKIMVDLSWDITVQERFYLATATLFNLPEGVVNPGFKIVSYIYTHMLTDIKEIPALNLTASNGAPKTVQGLNLPEQVKVTLYEGSIVSLPVAWMLDNVSYDPTVRTEQWVTVSGQFNSLPAGVTNSRMLMPYAYVQVHANANNITISGSPAMVTSRVVNYAPKTPAGLGLPAQVQVPLSNGTRIYVDVNWRLEWVNYEPSATFQEFYVTGNFINLPEDIYNSGYYNATAKVTVRDRYMKSQVDMTNWLDHGVPKTVEGLQLPAQVDCLLDDGSEVKLDVVWNVEAARYDPNSRLKQDFWVPGTVINLPAGITNPYGYKASAHLYVVEDPTNRYIISANPIEISTKVEYGAVESIEGFGLPQQIKVHLSDRTQKLIDVIWDMSGHYGTNNDQIYDPTIESGQSLMIKGTLAHLPVGIYDNYSNRVVWATVQIKPIVHKWIVGGYDGTKVSAPNGTAKQLDAFPLPAKIEVYLSDESTRMLELEWKFDPSEGWNRYSPTSLQYQTFRLYANFVNLPKDINDPFHNKVYADVEVYAAASNNNILRIPQKKLNLQNGFQLPKEINVLLENGSLKKVPVGWEITANYDGLKGKMIVPSDIQNTRNKQFVLGFETGTEAFIRDASEILYPPFGYSYLYAMEKVEISPGDSLPSTVPGRIGNSSNVPTNVCWNDRPIQGTEYKVGIPCFRSKYISNPNNIIAVAHIIPLTITSIQEFTEVYPYEQLPAQVTVYLNNGKTMQVDACYVTPNSPPSGVFSIVGYLCGLPDGIESSNIFFFANTYLSPSAPQIPKVVAVQQFNEIMSQTDLPKTINATLDNGQTISTAVCWETGNLDILEEDDVAIATGKLCKLAATEAVNPSKLFSLVYIHKSVSDLYFDFDVSTNDASSDEQVKNVRFVNAKDKIKIHVTSYDHPFTSATATYNGKTIQLKKLSENEFTADWKPDIADRGLGREIPDSAEEYEQLTGTSVSGAFHTLEVRIYPRHDTVRYIRKQVYIAIRDIADFKSIVTNLPLPRVVSPADASYNCLGFALDKPDQYLWYWFNNAYTAPIYPSQDEVIARLDIAGFEQTFNLNEAAVLAFGSNGQIYHFAKYDPQTGFVTSKDAVEEIVEYTDIPEYANHYGTVQLYFKKKS